MTKNLEFRRLQKGDEAELSQLFCEIFGDGKNADYWDWKYYRNPAGRHMTVVALHGPQLVGIIGNVPVKTKVGTKTLLAAQGVDTAISPAHRKRTTFFRLEASVREEMLKENVNFSYAFSIKQTYDVFTKVLGFSGVCPIFNMSKVINPGPYLRQKTGMRLIPNLLGAIGKGTISRLNRRGLSAPPGLNVADVTHFDHRFDDLWQSESKTFDIVVVRDSKYLNWRYIQSPFPYKVFCVESGKSVKGFVVLGCYQEEIARGRIVDFLAETGREDIIGLLLTRAINYFLDRRVDVISCWMLEHWPVFDALRKRGFVWRETPHALMVRSYSSVLGNAYLSAKDRWYTTMGDSDYF